MIITFEGIDGAGKSTQLKLLNEKLIKDGFNTFVTSSLGGTPIGRQIKTILLNSEYIDLHTELLLNAAAHQSSSLLIQQKLQENNKLIILSDRGLYSFIAYQGAGRGMFNEISKVMHLINNRLTPDLTFLLDISPENSLGRKEQKNLDRMEKESLDFHHKVRNSFLEMAQESINIIKLDALKTPNTISDIIYKRVLEKL
jgi:dTMP kinase